MNYNKITMWSIAVATGCLAALASLDALAQQGFYGGVSQRDHGSDAAGLRLGKLPSAWTKYGTPTTDDATSQALAYGGYRWSNDVAVEAAVNASDKYSLQPRTRSPSYGLADVTAKTWNVDLYTNWEVVRNFSLYGRLGYGQSDVRTGLNNASLLTTDSGRTSRNGINYGVGVRYDLTDALGVRVEYARFGRFAGEVVNGLPESDQVSIGVQFKF